MMAKNRTLNITLTSGKKLYFLSDLHLGAPDYNKSMLREQKLIRFLNSIEQDAQAVFFVGDIFDFWFEYKHVVPKGFIRFLAKLAHLKEKGILIYIFTGNHDIWMKDYLELEVGAEIFKDKLELIVPNKFSLSENKEVSILLAHGDGLGPGDRKYKIMKKIFTNRFCQWLFRWLHPDIGIKIAHTWSRYSFTDPGMEVFHGEDKEWLIQYCKKRLDAKHHDYFLMGHRHLPMDVELNTKSRYINLGDWILNSSYAAFDGVKMNLINFEDDKKDEK